MSQKHFHNTFKKCEYFAPIASLNSSFSEELDLFKSLAYWFNDQYR